MSTGKWISLLLLVVIGAIPCLSVVYNSVVMGFNGSTFFAALGFFLVIIVLGIHQLFFERED